MPAIPRPAVRHNLTSPLSSTTRLLSDLRCSMSSLISSCRQVGVAAAEHGCGMSRQMGRLQGLRFACQPARIPVGAARFISRARPSPCRAPAHTDIWASLSRRLATVCSSFSQRAASLRLPASSSCRGGTRQGGAIGETVECMSSVTCSPAVQAASNPAQRLHPRCLKPCIPGSLPPAPAWRPPPAPPPAKGNKKCSRSEAVQVGAAASCIPTHQHLHMQPSVTRPS